MDTTKREIKKVHTGKRANPCETTLFGERKSNILHKFSTRMIQYPTGFKAWSLDSPDASPYVV